jgi:periplasmic copper chaperone A
MRRATKMISGLVLALSLVATSCGDDEAEPATPADGGDEATITVTDAWARSPMPDRGAVYFMVSNQGTVADRLVGAAVADVGGIVEIHETIMEEGQAEMRPVEAVEIPAGGSVAFEPGGYHVMLLDLDAPLDVGDMLEVTLTFEAAGDVDVSAEVRPFVEDDGMGGENEGEM